MACFQAFEKSKGALRWPVQGKVLTEFGRVVHSIYKTVIMNTGIDIGAQKRGKSILYRIGESRVYRLDAGIWKIRDCRSRRVLYYLRTNGRSDGGKRRGSAIADLSWALSEIRELPEESNSILK